MAFLVDLILVRFSERTVISLRLPCHKVQRLTKRLGDNDNSAWEILPNALSDVAAKSASYQQSKINRSFAYMASGRPGLLFNQLQLCRYELL